MSADMDLAIGIPALFPGSEELGWQDRALCAETDPEGFFPEKGGSAAQAKRVCRGCEVRAECLEYALANGERFGIWGGLSERERRLLGGAARVRPEPAPVAAAPPVTLCPAAPEPVAPERCEVCGYLLTAPGHRLECGAS